MGLGRGTGICFKLALKSVRFGRLTTGCGFLRGYNMYSKSAAKSGIIHPGWKVEYRCLIFRTGAANIWQNLANSDNLFCNFWFRTLVTWECQWGLVIKWMWLLQKNALTISAHMPWWSCGHVRIQTLQISPTTVSHGACLHRQCNAKFHYDVKSLLCVTHTKWLLLSIIFYDMNSFFHRFSGE